jgi:hypothetical protein
MSRQCITCGVEIDPRRIAILPNTQTCTQHSTAEKKVAMTVQMGEGDHTWIETYAIDREVYDQIQSIEKKYKEPITPESKSEVTHTDEDDFTVWDETLLDGLDEDEFPDVEELLNNDEYTEDED